MHRLQQMSAEPTATAVPLSLTPYGKCHASRDTCYVIYYIIARNDHRSRPPTDLQISSSMLVFYAHPTTHLHHTNDSI